MARIAGIDRITVFEAVIARTRTLKREQDEGQRLRIHLLDGTFRGPRDPDGSLRFDINELFPHMFHGIDVLI